MRRDILLAEKTWVGVIVVALACLIIFPKLKFLGLPLHGDEIYYANPQILLGLSQWTQISFGHPPGWNFINGLFYSFLGYSPLMAHIIGLSVSVLGMVGLFLIVKRQWGVPVSLMLMTGIFYQQYFLESSSLNHPIIAAAICGFISLFFVYEKKYLLFFVFGSLSVLLRESSLVFVAAAWLITSNKKTALYSLGIIGVLSLCYVWKFLVDGGLLINPQMYAVHKSSSPIFVFNFDHVMAFYKKLFTLESHFIFFLALAVILIDRTIRKEWRVPRITYGFLFVFAVHSLFFALYTDDAIRNTFYSSLALMAAICSLMPQILNSRKRLYLILVIAVGIPYMVFQSLERINADNYHLARLKRTAKVYSKIDQTLISLNSKLGRLDILSTNPYDNLLSDPTLGYVRKEREIRHHGGVSGLTQIANPDLIIIPNKKINFALKELHKKATQSNYILYKSYKCKKCLIVQMQIYAKKEILKRLNARTQH